MVDGFSSPQIRVMDVTRPEAVREVAGAVKPEGNGFAIEFRVPGQGNRTLLVFTEAEIKVPAAIMANRPSTWHQAGQRADMVIIAHGDFVEKSHAPQATSRDQGYSVALIDAEDLYDEFSFGMKTPQAIKDFLTRAHTSGRHLRAFCCWWGMPASIRKIIWVLATMDFLPTKLLDTTYMETASDDWFVDFNGDGLPDMAIGRLPVQTAEEAARSFPRSSLTIRQPAGAWATEALMVADENGDFDFEQASQQSRKSASGADDGMECLPGPDRR